MSWYKNITGLDLVSTYGRHVRLGQMLKRDCIESRLSSEEGLSYTEFTYQLFQSYDWLHLYREYGCRFQIGGHDQMGNIVSGHDLVSRYLNTHVFGKFTIFTCLLQVWNLSSIVCSSTK